MIMFSTFYFLGSRSVSSFQRLERHSAADSDFPAVHSFAVSRSDVDGTHSAVAGDYFEYVICGGCAGEISGGWP